VPAFARKLAVPLPKGITIEQQGYDLAITRRWLSPKSLFEKGAVRRVDRVHLGYEHTNIPDRLD
jgi:hypothetical protein